MPELSAKVALHCIMGGLHTVGVSAMFCHEGRVVHDVMHGLHFGCSDQKQNSWRVHR